jgi:hypothetical protein
MGLSATSSALQAFLSSFFKTITVMFFVLGFAAAQAKDLTPEQKLSDLNQLVSRLKSGYGPLHYKQKNMGIDIDVVAAKYAQRVAATKSNSEFYYEIIRFIAEFKDGHFSANIPSTHRAYLPFVVDLVQGQVLIDKIDRTKLPEATFPYTKGDEILEFNGRPVFDEVADIATYIPNGYAGSVKRIATMALTNRRGSRMPVPSAAAVTVKIRRGTSGVIDTVDLKWAYEGQPMDEFVVTPKFLSRKPGQPIARDYDHLSAGQEMSFLETPNIENDFRCSGGTRTQMPPNAKVIMTTPFVAYYYPTAKGNVGYLRIPHYMAPNLVTGAQEFELRYAQYEYAVRELEQNTVGLVIDQQHNCGGSVDYLHKIAALFTTAPFKPVQFELLANKEEFLTFSKYVDSNQDFTIEYKNFLKVLSTLKTSYERGDFMTPKLALSGEDMIAPNTIHYTKPIVMMIDEMSGSGGDAFPALLQGLGRAVLIGERTMGLGGHVVEQPPLFYSQIQARITKSLFYRPDGVAIENNGAQPDIAYLPTRDDFMYGYRDQQQFVTTELLKLVNAPVTETKP